MAERVKPKLNITPSGKPSADPEPDVNSVTPVRSLIVFAVIIGCFTVVYPPFIHPLFKYAIYGSSANKQLPAEERFLPPKFQQRPGGQMVQPQKERTSAMHERHSHHPGARFTGDYHVPESKGSLYFLLPIYTVGIIAFLLYTFYKVLSRSNQFNQPPTRAGNIRYNPDEQHFEPIIRSNRMPQQSRREQELSATPQISEAQLKELEIKLAETEAQMNELIEKMSLIKSVENKQNQALDTVEAECSNNLHGSGVLDSAEYDGSDVEEAPTHVALENLLERISQNQADFSETDENVCPNIEDFQDDAEDLENGENVDPRLHKKQL